MFDFCQNMAGFCTLRVPEGLDTVAGTNISLWHAEAIHGPPPAPIFHHYGPPNNELNTYSPHEKGKRQIDRLIDLERVRV